MSCKCKEAKAKAKAKLRSAKIKQGSLPTVSLNVLKVRREACKDCSHATKNPSPKFAAFGGLTSQSQCKLSQRKILECLKDPLYTCPEGHFTCDS